jgi:hypothetical protein
VKRRTLFVQHVTDVSRHSVPFTLGPYATNVCLNYLSPEERLELFKSCVLGISSLLLPHLGRSWCPPRNPAYSARPPIAAGAWYNRLGGRPAVLGARLAGLISVKFCLIPNALCAVSCELRAASRGQKKFLCFFYHRPQKRIFFWSPVTGR